MRVLCSHQQMELCSGHKAFLSHTSNTRSGDAESRHAGAQRCSACRFVPIERYRATFNNEIRVTFRDHTYLMSLYRADTRVALTCDRLSVYVKI